MTEGNLNQKLCTIIIAMCMTICGMASDHKEVVTTTKFDAQSIIEIHRIQQAVQETQAESKFSMDGKTNHTKFSNISIKTSKRAVRTNALVKLNSDIGTSVLYDKGFNVTPLCNNFSIVNLPVDSLEALSKVDKVERISFGKRKMRLMLNKANTYTGVDLIHEGKSLNYKDNSLYQPFTGKGVMIGIFDKGFDPNHAMFLDENGVSRFKVIKTRSSSPITDSEKIASFETDDRTETHATHICGIAAGAFHGDSYQIEGVAPKADLAMGPIFNEASELEYIKYLAEYCKARKERLVINMSYGSRIGPHDGSDLYTQALTELVNQYDIVACLSAGNDADHDIVQKHIISSEDDCMRAIFNMSSSRDLDIYFTTSKPSEISIDMVIVDTNSQEIAHSYPIVENGSVQGLDINDEYLRATMLVNRESIHDGLAGYRITSDNVLPAKSNYRLGYIVKGSIGQELACYTEPISPFSKELGQWTEGLTSNGTISVESCGKEFIVTGAYNTAPKVAYLKSGSMSIKNNKDTGWGCQEGDITYYSSFGTKYDGENLPNICAPGAIIQSSFNSYCVLSSLKKTITKTDTEKGNVYSFCAMNGTSMASPYMAGIAALWLEANPKLTHKEIKDIAMLTASNDYACNEGNYFKEQGRQAGAGKVDAYTGLMYILKEDAATHIDTPSEKSFLIRNISKDEYEAFCAGATSLTAALYNMEGKKVYSSSASGNTINISTTGLQKGIYILNVSSNNKKFQMKFVVK